MKLAINLALSFGMLALCAYFIWPTHRRAARSVTP